MKISKAALIKLGAAIVILASGVAAMQILASSKAEANKSEVEAPVRTVETMIPEFRDIPYLVEGNGVVESAGSLQIYSTIPGKVVYSLNNLSSGTSVKKGDILLKIDSRQTGNSLNLARAELIKAVASLVPQFKTSNETLYNKWNLYLNSLNFQAAETPEIPAVTDAREKLLISTYGIYSTYYNVKNAEIMLEQHTIIAPFDGYISSSGILVDSFVNGGQPLMTLVDAENMKVSVPLTVDDLNKVNSNNSPYVEIRPSIGNGTVLIGKLVSRDMIMESSSQMFNVFIEFTNPDLDPRFAPGNYVDIVIEGKTLFNTAAIPRYAVLDNKFVYTYENKLLSKEDVSIKAIFNDTVYIDNTLPPDTEIITTILQKPLIGMKLSSLADEEAESVSGVSDEKDS
ncbi:MAG: efflux RND transporter periplasmic adaptor subunit [Spirochaetaceae bacterium]|jgi:RND family efflux transporter MFP subunit|nr:efflux RND transporter periplasmic adaptor subunit [Spirochaetaceae bacterium]